MSSVSGPAAEARASEERYVRETGAALAIAELAEPVLKGLGFRLVLARILSGQGTIVEIMAERPDGSMTIDDCRTVSLALSPVLDVHDPIAGAYRLQISSPGIDRPLVRPSDFDQWAGFEAKIELKELIDGRRRFRGVVEGFEDGEVRIEVDLGKDQGVKLLGLPIGLVEEAKLVLTDELVRESLRRTKKALAELSAPDGAEADAARDGADIDLDTLEIQEEAAAAPGRGRRKSKKARALDRKTAQGGTKN
ncbi:MAG: ribosome maturation factor RimP [Proteobacteria bacterium]|nr:ribosome maturation factor RimP [Pseudomonadota bacterium]